MKVTRSLSEIPGYHNLVSIRGNVVHANKRPSGMPLCGRFLHKSVFTSESVTCEDCARGVEEDAKID